jgi:hypothetical protein
MNGKLPNLQTMMILPHFRRLCETMNLFVEFAWALNALPERPIRAMENTSEMKNSKSPPDNPPSLPYDIVRLADDVEADAKLMLFLEPYFKEMAHDGWRWLYRKFLKPGDVYIACYEGRLIGHFSTIQFPIQAGNTCIDGGEAHGAVIDAKAVASMPAPVDRRVFINIAKQMLADAAERKLGVIYCFPGKLAHLSCVMSGFKSIPLDLHNSRCVLRMRSIPGKNDYKREFIRPIYNFFMATWLALKVRPNARVRRLDVNDRAALDQFCDALAHRNPGVISVRRDWRYLNWRYNENPNTTDEVFGIFDSSGQITGLMTVRLRPRDGQMVVEILDIATLNKRSMNALLRFSLWWGRERSADFVEVWTIPGAPAYATLNARLRPCGFWKLAPAPRPMVVFSTIGDAPYDYANWYVTKSFRIQ